MTAESVDRPDGDHDCSDAGMVMAGRAADCEHCHPTYLTAPAMPFRAYGVDLSTMGEEGSWVALGHIEPRRMLAAMRKAGRELYGSGSACTASEETFGEGWDIGHEDRPSGATVDTLAAELTHKRATFAEHSEFGWWCDTGDDAQSNPHAIDVTLWWV